MNTAILYGGISGLALLVGAGSGILLKLKQKSIARIMAFGSGVLICAITIGLMEEAFGLGGFDAITLGFLIGGLVFIGGDYLIHITGGRSHKRKILQQSSPDTNGLAITLGAVLDAIPEAIALGVAIFMGQGTGILILSAIVLSNFPEGISSITGLKKIGFSNLKILGIWLLVGLIMIAITILSYAFLHDISGNWVAIIESFAAGAVLAMLADTMMPEAFEEGGFSIGLLTVLGFLAAFIISKL